MIALRSNRVLCNTDLLPADVVIEGEYILDVLPYGSAPSAIDLGDRLLSPGFVDLHSDAVEKEIEPRSGVFFPVDAALVELDKKLACCGITTMFHAVAFYEESVAGIRKPEMSAHIIRSIHELNKQTCRVDNFVHVRYEATSFGSVAAIVDLIESNMVQLLSFMDHSPGQGQYRRLDNWLRDHQATFGIDEDEARQVIGIMDGKKHLSAEKLQHLAQCARSQNITLISHDDDGEEKIDAMRTLGVSVSEFPVNEDAAFYARRHGLATGMGAPNVVRGTSHNDNISARRLIEKRACDYLCSDYHPVAMVQAVYTLNRELGVSLGESLRLITANPARIAGLSDRGEIRPDSLADLAVIDDSGIATVVFSMKSGIPVFNGLGRGLGADALNHRGSSAIKEAAL
jgi:alpha-D-ribose 1-methylphosphonate 5-triphosphate diphosphatase